MNKEVRLSHCFWVLLAIRPYLSVVPCSPSRSQIRWYGKLLRLCLWMASCEVGSSQRFDFILFRVPFLPQRLCILATHCSTWTAFRTSYLRTMIPREMASDLKHTSAKCSPRSAGAYGYMPTITESVSNYVKGSFPSRRLSNTITVLCISSLLFVHTESCKPLYQRDIDLNDTSPSVVFDSYRHI